MLSVVYVYPDYVKLCVVCIDGRMYVCCGECNVVSNECNEPTSCLVQYIGAHCGEVMYCGCFGFRGELGFLNFDDDYMCVVNKQLKLLEFVFESLIRSPSSLQRLIYSTSISVSSVLVSLLISTSKV